MPGELLRNSPLKHVRALNFVQHTALRGVHTHNTHADRDQGRIHIRDLGVCIRKAAQRSLTALPRPFYAIFAKKWLKRAFFYVFAKKMPIFVQFLEKTLILVPSTLKWA